MERFSRTALLLGEAAMEKLKKAHVAIFGIGGVGGYVCEALARSGVGSFTLVDSDRVAFSNINRQIIATENNIGRYKTEAMKERILDIDPEAEVETAEVFYLPETADMFDFSRFSYVADAVDTVTAKLLIIERANAAGIPVISSMGAGHRLDPTKITVSDIYDTAEDHLARVMRRECRKRGIERLKVVCSSEKALEPREKIMNGEKQVPGSIAFVPSVAGLVLASEIIKDIINGN